MVRFERGAQDMSLSHRCPPMSAFASYCAPSLVSILQALRCLLGYICGPFPTVAQQPALHYTTPTRRTLRHKLHSIPILQYDNTAAQNALHRGRPGSQNFVGHSAGAQTLVGEVSVVRIVRLLLVLTSTLLLSAACSVSALTAIALLSTICPFSVLAFMHTCHA